MGSTSRSGWTLRRWRPSAGSPSKLEHDGREIRLREWRNFRGKHTLFRRNVEDWNEGDEQARLLSMLPEAWIKRVTKEESKRAKSNHTVKMMLHKEYHSNVVAWAKKNVARDVKRHSLRKRSSSSPSRAIARRPRCGALTIVS